MEKEKRARGYWCLVIYVDASASIFRSVALELGDKAAVESILALEELTSWVLHPF